MNGVVLWSCAINLLHTSSSSVSGLARCGNSIPLPLPNLVAQLAILLLSVLCSHYSACIISFSHPVSPFHPSVCVCVDIYCVDKDHIFMCVVTAYAKWTSAMHFQVFTVCSKVALHRFYFLFLCVCIIVYVDVQQSWQFKSVSRFSSNVKVILLLQWVRLVSWQISLL